MFVAPFSEKRAKKALMLAVKIAMGSSAAIAIAELLGLNYSASAGTITLLTLMGTKWDTVKLSVWRLITLAFASVAAGVLFNCLKSEWLAYGIYILLIVAIPDLLGWRTTISVNAVIGAHFLQSREFSIPAVWNELQLVLIGIIIAIILNLFNANKLRKRAIAEGMQDIETGMQLVLFKLARYLKNEHDTGEAYGVWDDLEKMMARIKDLILDAHEYQNNTFQDMRYYYTYLDMRQEQCIVLHRLQAEMSRMRTMPVQALVIADYMIYLSQFVVEINYPELQIERLRELFAAMKAEDLPVTREEFESRAILYHVLMDLEDFLLCKDQFVASLTEGQLQRHWNDPASV